jgi:hypothetical protein
MERELIVDKNSCGGRTIRFAEEKFSMSASPTPRPGEARDSSPLFRYSR